MSIRGRIAAALGLSVAGRRVWLHVDESEDVDLNGARAFGRVTTIRDARAEIQLEQPLRLGSESLVAVTAVPRHRGYGFDHAVFGPIAVLLDRPNGDGRSSFAIAILRTAGKAR